MGYGNKVAGTTLKKNATDVGDGLPIYQTVICTLTKQLREPGVFPEFRRGQSEKDTGYKNRHREARHL